MAQPTDASSHLYDRSDNPMIADQLASIAAAIASHSLTDADANLGATTQAEIEGVLDALGVAINLIITRLEDHGLIANN